SIAVLGTGSDVGKSIVTAGICRVLTRAGKRVAPFKSQNMSNNASPALITNSWGEIGTAQALQAEACGLMPRVEMNPILLKSGGRSSDGAYLCSVIVLGKHYVTQTYGALGEQTSRIMELVLKAHASLADVTNSEVVVCEGAGSCTELNLMERDVVNLPLVRKLNCPWLLVADIDKGGVFAQIIGTRECVEPSDWNRCCGVIVNRLRGDASYFEPGPSMIEERVGKPVFVVPWLHGLHLPEEDGVGGNLGTSFTSSSYSDGGMKFNVAVVAYPHVAIDSDLVPVERDNMIELKWHRDVMPPPYPETHAIILPGSRLTRSDLVWLTRQTRWSEYIKDHVNRGGVVVGICGGYQMLGTMVSDDGGVEGMVHDGDNICTAGLGLLPAVTTIESTDQKVVSPRTAILDGEEIHGFELHCGKTVTANEEDGDFDFELTEVKPLLHLKDTNEYDGMRVGKVAGCYLHCLFSNQYA
ncbi:cobyrinic acid synthase, partial [Thalassiosira pseudonana CCMP1335]